MLVQIIYSDDIDFVGVLLFPISANLVIDLKYLKPVDKKAFEGFPAKCSVISGHNTSDISYITCFNGAAVFIDKSEPKTQKMVFDFIFKRPTVRLGQNWTHFFNQAKFLFESI